MSIEDLIDDFITDRSFGSWVSCSENESETISDDGVPLKFKDEVYITNIDELREDLRALARKIKIELNQ